MDCECCWLISTLAAQARAHGFDCDSFSFHKIKVIAKILALAAVGHLK